MSGWEQRSSEPVNEAQIRISGDQKIRMQVIGYQILDNKFRLIGLMSW